MINKRFIFFKTISTMSVAATPFFSFPIFVNQNSNLNLNTKDTISKISFEDSRKEFFELSNLYSDKLFDNYNKVGEGILRKITPVVQNRLYQNTAFNNDWVIDEKMNFNIEFSKLPSSEKFNKPMFLNQSVKCDSKQDLKSLLGEVNQSAEPTSKPWKYINLINLSGRGNTSWINVFNEFWHGGYEHLIKDWSNITSHYDATNVGVNGQYLNVNKIDNNKNIGQWKIHWPTKTVDPTTLAEGKVASESSLKLQFKNSTGDGNWKDANDRNDEWCKIHGIKNMPKEAWENVLSDTGYFVFFGGSGLPSQKCTAIHNLQFLDGYGGNDHEVWKPIYYSLEDLFEISDIGFDKTNGYYYVLNYNDKLLLAAIAIHGNQGVSELLKKEFDSNSTKCLINDIKYFDFKLNGEKHEYDGGRSTWINKNDLMPNIKENYDELMNQLYLNLNSFVETKELSYDNYFVIKKLIQDYSKKNHLVPDFAYLKEQFSKNSLWQNNGWNNWVTKYNVSENTLEVLLTILPQLKISQWTMSNNDITPGSYTNGCWTNPLQKLNVGNHQASAGSEEIKYSEFSEIIKNGNKVYINPENKDPANIEFRTNVIVKREAQDLNKFEVNDQDIHKSDDAGIYFPTNINNIDILNKKTFDSIKVKHDAKDTVGSKIRTIDSLILEKNIKKIVKVDDFFPNIKIEPKEQFKSMSPSESIKTVDGATISKKLQQILKDQLNKDVSPFIEVDVYSDTYSFDLPDSNLELLPDDTNGQLLVRLLANDGTILDTVKINGFKNSIKPIDPEPGKTGLSTGAIAGISVGAVTGTVGITATTFIVIKKRKPNIAKKSKIKNL